MCIARDLSSASIPTERTLDVAERQHVEAELSPPVRFVCKVWEENEMNVFSN